MTTWRENQPFIKDRNFLNFNQNKQSKTKVYTMKFTHTLALIAATMAALPTTGAVKLDANQASAESLAAASAMAEQVVGFIFETCDDNKDGQLSREELGDVFAAIHKVYDAADMKDGNPDGNVTAENLIREIKIGACVGQCQLNGGCPCAEEEENTDKPESMTEAEFYANMNETDANNH